MAPLLLRFIGVGVFFREHGDRLFELSPISHF